MAAWELGSGGCGPYLLMWMNRIFTTFFLGTIFAPVAAWRAFRRGRAQHNLHRCDVQRVLRQELDEVRASVGVRGPAAVAAG